MVVARVTPVGRAAADRLTLANEYALIGRSGQRIAADPGARSGQTSRAAAAVGPQVSVRPVLAECLDVTGLEYVLAATRSRLDGGETGCPVQRRRSVHAVNDRRVVERPSRLAWGLRVAASGCAHRGRSGRNVAALNAVDPDDNFVQARAQECEGGQATRPTYLT